MNTTIFNSMDGSWRLYVKQSKSEKGKYWMIWLICTIFQKNKTKHSLVEKETRYVVTQGRGWEEGKLEGSSQKVQRYKLPVLRHISTRGVITWCQHCWMFYRKVPKCSHFEEKFFPFLSFLYMVSIWEDGC